LLIPFLSAQACLDQEQQPFEDLLSLDGVLFGEQLTVKLA
jgi:hypothetical protein